MTAQPSQSNQYLYVAMVQRGCRLCKVLCRDSSTGTKFMQWGCGRYAHQLSERAHASSSCLNTSHKPVEMFLLWWSRVRGGGAVQSGCRGKWSCCIGTWQAHIPRCRSHSKTCTPCFHTSRTLFPHPEFYYDMSMVCAMMACYVLESSEYGSSGQIFIPCLGL
jgi:hypothetical protein